MRVRERIGPRRDEFNRVLYRYHAHQGGEMRETKGNRLLDGDYEKFTDLVGNEQGINPCVHVTRRYTPIPMDGYVSYDLNKVYTYGPPMFYWVSTPNTPGIGQVDRDKALGFLLDLFESPPPAYNIGETVAELVLGVKSVIGKREAIMRHFKRWSSWIRHFSPSAWKAWLSLQAKAIKQQTREAFATDKKIREALKKAPAGIASSYLSWHFGIKPFIQAIMDFEGAHKRVLDQMKGLIERNNQWIRHTRKHEIPQPAPGQVPTAFGWHTFAYVRTTSLAKIQLGVTVKTVYPELEKAYGDLKSLRLTSKAGFKAAAYSLGFTPLVAWQLIPFSFVVDWFVRVDDKLKTYSGRIADGEILTKDPCTSETTRVEFDHYYGNHCPSYKHSNGTTYYNSPVLCGVGSTSLFVRSPQLPSRSFAPGELTPSQEKFILALALQRT